MLSSAEHCCSAAALLQGKRDGVILPGPTLGVPPAFKIWMCKSIWCAMLLLALQNAGSMLPCCPCS